MEGVALGQVIRKCADIVVEEGSRLYWWKEDVQWIQTQMSLMLASMKDADSNATKSEGLSNLRRIIKDLAHDVEDMIDTYFPCIIESQKRNKKLKCVCNWYTRHCFVMKVEGIRKRVESVNKAIPTFGINVNGGVVAEGEEWDSRAFVYQDQPSHHVIIGLDEDFKKLNAIMDNEDVNYQVVSIVGMAGVGKTTLAKRVFDSAKSHFECSAKVYVSQDPNITKVFRDIATQVGMDVKKEANLQLQLIEFLRGKRYVILFDDIWKTDAWDALKSIIPNNSESGGTGRVIVTSRSGDVGRYINRGNPLHELVPLNIDDSWELFSNIVGNMNNIDSADLANIGRQILGRCGGVPLAIEITASLLLSKERTVNAWRVVHGLMGQEDEEDKKCSEALALSYKELPLSLKPCFLYFGLFPEDDEISAFQLINMWVAEKFIKANGDLSAEQVGEDYLRRLVSRNLIEVVSRRFDGSVRSCRIHDLLHALCVKLARDADFFNTCSRSDSGTKVRRVTTYRTSVDDYLSLHHQTPKLRAFLCFKEDVSIQGNKFVAKLAHFRFLRVLNVEFHGTIDRPISLANLILSSCVPVVDPIFILPSEISNLIHLSYLRLVTISSVIFPATISNLKNLLTLELLCADVMLRTDVMLPASIWKMKQLRHMLLSNNVIFQTSLFGAACHKVTNIDDDEPQLEIDLPNLQTLRVGDTNSHLIANHLSRLTSLRKLNIFVDSGRMIEELSGETPISHNLENLQVRWRYSYDASVTKFDLSRYSNLRKMKLVFVMRKLTASNTFPPFLTNLTLLFTDLVEDPMETLKTLPNLRVLKLLSHCYIGDELVCSGPAGENFPQLQVLHLNYMPQLKELIVEEGGMPRLNKFTIKHCRNLIMLPERLHNMANVEP